MLRMLRVLRDGRVDCVSGAVLDGWIGRGDGSGKEVHAEVR